ncbi:UPF0182 family protein [Lentibacillus amyloliquefaciens]|uniref:UPF0182 protein AOX59_12350 n=1 Tax=Lentibacillus amyloliquefaciens TaxID=1472767 RepID=A0A0U3W853_9BACI|nr:UPF0182 family protein [Lentibacillus amyloliquefaciens]ALX49312.1 hypothetical protein AOX59_12350 [Lentibacillus amyloliquefaciens]
MDVFDGGSNGSKRPNITWNKKYNWIGYIVLGIILAVIIGLFALQLITDYIWMDSLNYGNVFTTILTSKVLLGVAGFILFAVTTFFTIFWIRRSYLKHFTSSQLPPLLEKRKTMMGIMLAISAVVGLFGSSIIQGVGWESALKLINHASFNQADPYFGLDISFYVYVLPMLNLVVFVLLGLAIFFLLVEIGAYSVFHMYRMSRSAQLHLGLTLGFIGLMMASYHLLQPFGTLASNQVSIFQESVVEGLSYTDDVINIPKAYILAAVALLMTIWMIIKLVRGNIQTMLTPIVVYIGLVVVGQGVSVAVQNFVVSPNEFAMEEPYLEDNLEYTRAAYDLDDINQQEHPADGTLTADMVERNQGTIDNVRMNDVRPLLDVYNQVQTFRTYYEFNDVDVDRYQVDGNYEQVFLGARELDTSSLPDQAQTWVNQNLRYTHGYGVAMSHVNQVTAQGQPEYMLQDVPPEGVMDVNRPQIYFGENNAPNVITNSEVDEFDYPDGDSNASNRYKAETGIPLTGINRLLFTIDEGNFRMLLSDQLTEDSQLLATRNIMDRINRIAPFFNYDQDPYLVVRDDGSLVWMIDAYLTAENYPYSEAFQGDMNYIRNSIKVMVDAYTGEVNFYAADLEEPLLQTFQNIFPGLITEEVPDDIRAHFRYPTDLFSIQASMYGTYHMTNLEVFYNREDTWQFPTERYFDEDIEMEPYYITMKLPGEDEEEFIQMLPYTPKNRQNMIAWIGVRNDGENYGDMMVYEFPKQRNVYGPQQIENRINQDSEISQELNLWAQGGSDVIRGNLLAIPIEDTMIYVEPIYIESNNETSLPEVKRVVVAYEDEIVMEADFDTALEEMLNTVDSDSQDGQQDEDQEEGQDDAEQGDQQEPEDPLMGAEDQLQEFSDLFESYQQELSQGNWEEAASIMSELEGLLDEMESSNGSDGNSGAEPPEDSQGSNSQPPEDNTETPDNPEE